MFPILSRGAWASAVVACAFMLGCAEQRSAADPIVEPKAPAASAPVVSDVTPAVATDTSEHGHKAGSHGGIMVSLGRDSYHAEAVFEKGGLLRLYTLGNDESRVIDIEKQTLKAFVKAEGDSASQPFSMEPEPQEGDAEGRTSQFIGNLPEGLDGKKLAVTIPNIVIAGERFRMGFESTLAEHDEVMPDKVTNEAEQELYLRPGGLYTAADIQANGGTTASVKFRGMMSVHNSKPQTGDKICPISLTKANPQFTWVVGGKSYEFCCPPCVDEFVKLAKITPDEIKAPESYVQP
jgi:YHS domain-containing protein